MGLLTALVLSRRPDSEGLRDSKLGHDEDAHGRTGGHREPGVLHCEARGVFHHRYVRPWVSFMIRFRSADHRSAQGKPFQQTAGLTSIERRQSGPELHP